MACHLHKVGFYKPKAKAINCMALETTEKKLAISRQDASIEVWDVSYSPYLLWHIPGVSLGSIEALCWIEQRLLSTGLSGALIEWDLKSLHIKKSVLLTGHAAWCIDAHSRGDGALVAVGTEQGYINLFSTSVANDDIQYEKIFDKQEGRILCCKFNKSGDLVVTGSSDSVRIWSVASGQALKKMEPSRRNKNVETVIWSMAVLSDLTIITGDSCGRLTFWDGGIGEQIECFTTHRSDILSICVTNDENVVYAAGVDPLIVSVSSVYLKTRQWVRGVQRSIHRHDVRSLIAFDDKLISAGIDGYIAVSSFPPRQLQRWPPLPPKRCITLCPEPKLLMLRYSNHIDIWKLGAGNTTRQISHKEAAVETSADAVEMDTEFENSESLNKKYLKLDAKPVKLLTLHAKKDDQLLCCCASRDGKFMAYSTDNNIRIFKFSIEQDGTPALSHILPFDGAFNICHNMTFSHNCTSLITATADGLICVIQIDASGTGEVIQTINTLEHLKDGTIQLLATSKRLHIIAADSIGTVAVWQQKKQGNQYDKLVTLPKYACTASALGTSPDGRTVFISYVDHKMIEYDLVKLRIQWSVNLNRVTPIVAITFDPRNPELIMAHDHSSVILIKKTTDRSEKSKIANTQNDTFETTILKYKHVAFLEWLKDMEAVLVEVTPENLASDLPPAFAIKRFGAM